ncbi:MAG: hisC, partial [Rhodospirillales bacterium]|nr:hisC [Rhodospirillales bacterium]
SAYAEFVTSNDYDAGIALVESAENVVMLRTFSKIYALGGLRLGWAYCPTPIADVLNRIRGAFNINSAVQAAGVAAVEDIATVDQARAHNAVWRAWLTEALEKLGLTVNPSAANFVLVRFPDAASHNAVAAREFLQSRGILTRGMHSYGLPAWLRITIGLEDEMRIVVDEIAAFLGRT